MSTVNNTNHTDPIGQFNKAAERADVLVPNFYLREHIGQCEDWSDEKWDAFKAYVDTNVCQNDWVRDGVSECIEYFEDEYDEPEEAEEPAAEDTALQCITCDKEIVRDGLDHDQCILVNKGDDLICQDCPWVYEAKCGECPVCKEQEEEKKEEELAGDL